MAREVEPSGGGVGTRLVVALVVLVVGWLVLRIVLGVVWSLIRTLLLLALVGAVAWVVIVGPPGRRD